MTQDAADTTEAAADEAEVDVDGVAAEVAAHDEALGEAVAATGDRLRRVRQERAELAAEVEELTERVQRVQADFQNYKKRAEEQQAQIRERATEDLVERLLEVRDNLERALDQDADADVRDGVEATLREFDRVLDDEGVERIEPAVGADVDPRRHEVVHRESESADAIASVYRPGYAMAEKVLRPAQVTVGPTPDDEAEDSA